MPAVVLLQRPGLLLSTDTSCSYPAVRPAAVQLDGVDLPDSGPYEHRIELLTPPYIAAGIERPTITGTPKAFNRGE